MSERRIGDGQGNAILEYAVCANACKGAPLSIKPGCVVAMAESLQAIVARWDKEVPEECVTDEHRQARAALALYNGTTTGQTK